MITALAACVLIMPAKIDQRWVYLATNLLVDKNIDANIALMQRAKGAGYNGVLVADSKFMRWDALPEHYKENATRFRNEVKRLGMEFIACVAPIGYSNDLLSRDPNLAEGLPVKDAPFTAKDRKLKPDADCPSIVDAGFEDGIKGWAWADPACSIDIKQHAEGSASLKMTNANGANARASQPLAVKPFRNYHLSVMVKTQDFGDAGSTNILLLGKNGQALQYRTLPIERTMDWKRIDVTFNTLDQTQINFYIGVWGMRSGTIWWDDIRIEPAGLVNLVRRPGAPFTVTSDDGKTVYTEGKDYVGAVDPKMGNVAWPGDYDVWHDGPLMMLPAGSRIRSGDHVRVSYSATALVYDGQAMCCMAEPGVDKILEQNMHDIHRFLKPDGYMLSHDEIRMTGWDESCVKTGKTPGQILADNVRKCIAMVRKEDPGKTVYAWSDMFDPNHNAAATGPYYLVKGDGPWKGSWTGLDKDIVILNWNSDPNKRKATLDFFAGRGHRQILAGYYDGPVDAIKGWLSDASATNGFTGVMYTTWRGAYDDLEGFGKLLR